jgi:Transposase
MIDAHWDGIAAYCEPENKVPLGFVEGLNNKIRVIQRRAYGLVTRNTSGSKYLAACRRKSKNLSLRTNGRQRRDAEFQRQSATDLRVDRVPSRTYACQVRSRRRRWPERPDFTGVGSGEDNGQQIDLLIDQSTWVPVIWIVGRAIDPIAELHATAITCQLSHQRQIPESHSNSKKITHSIGRRPSFSIYTVCRPEAAPSRGACVCMERLDPCIVLIVGSPPCTGPRFPRNGRLDRWPT